MAGKYCVHITLKLNSKNVIKVRVTVHNEEVLSFPSASRMTHMQGSPKMWLVAHTVWSLVRLLLGKVCKLPNIFSSVSYGWWMSLRHEISCFI